MPACRSAAPIDGSASASGNLPNPSVAIESLSPVTIDARIWLCATASAPNSVRAWVNSAGRAPPIAADWNVLTSLDVNAKRPPPARKAVSTSVRREG